MTHFTRRNLGERLVRRVWQARFDPLAWLLSVIYGGVTDLRNALWTLGIAQARISRIPVISVGGLTLGGSGKTPVTAALARHLADTGLRVAVLTPGQKDELDVHAMRNVDVPVSGGRSRIELARKAADQGAEVILLDSGFQHRRLARDLDIVTILVDNCSQLRLLPAGPARERWAALDRADCVVLVSRHAPRARGKAVERQVREAFPHLLVANASIEAGRLEPVSEAAGEIADPDPELAVAGVMWPELFFADLGAAGLAPMHELSLADHAEPDDRSVALMVRLAGSKGIVCTAKDSRKLAALLPGNIPIWHVLESVTWDDAGRSLLDGTERLVRQDSSSGQYTS